MNNEQLGISKAIEPMCGWDWIRQHLNDVVPYHIEIIRDGAKFTITSKDSNKANQAIREALKR